MPDPLPQCENSFKDTFSLTGQGSDNPLTQWAALESKVVQQNPEEKPSCKPTGCKLEKLSELLFFGFFFMVYFISGTFIIPITM
jgi:hypothetical protein